MGNSVFNVNMSEEELDAAKVQLMVEARQSFADELRALGTEPTLEHIAAWQVGFIDGFDGATVETARLIADTMEASGHDVSGYLIGRI